MAHQYHKKRFHAALVTGSLAGSGTGGWITFDVDVEKTVQCVQMKLACTKAQPQTSAAGSYGFV